MKEAYAKDLKSGCAVPLLCHGKLVGSMMLASLRESAFTEDDADPLTHIGTQVAIAVENAVNYERLRCAECEVVRERDRTKLLLDINNAVVSHLDLRDLVKSISASLRQIIPHDGAFFTLLDLASGGLRVQALDLRVLDQTPFEEGVSILPEGTPEGEAIASGRPVLVVPRVDLTRFHNPWVRNAVQNGVRSGCAVALMARGRILNLYPSLGPRPAEYNTSAESSHSTRSQHEHCGLKNSTGASRIWQTTNGPRLSDAARRVIARHRWLFPINLPLNRSPLHAPRSRKLVADARGSDDQHWMSGVLLQFVA